MKHQTLFSSKSKSKKIMCRLLHFLFGALRVKHTYFRISTYFEVFSLSKAPFVTKLTLASDKLTLKSVIASGPELAPRTPRILIEEGLLSTVDDTVTAVPISASSLMLVVSASSDHSGAV